MNKLTNCTPENIQKLSVGDKFVFKSSKHYDEYLITNISKKRRGLMVGLKLIASKIYKNIGATTHIYLLNKNYLENSPLLKEHFLVFSLNKKVNKLLEL